MRLKFLMRKGHQWLALILGVQTVVWLVSGVYMVSVKLDYIHGDHLVRRMDEALKRENFEYIPFYDLQKRYPLATRISLINWSGLPHYRVYDRSASYLIDARTGKKRSPLKEEDVRRFALYHFTGEDKIHSVRLLTDQKKLPKEVRFYPVPLWQVSFKDDIATHFYVSPDDGRLIARRHMFWRLFDLMWMFHIMDYDMRDNIHNILLRISAILGVLLSMTGIFLLFHSFRRRRKKKTTRGRV